MGQYIMKLTMEFGGELRVKTLAAVLPIEKDELGENAIRLAAINLAESLIEKLKEEGNLSA